MERHRLLGTVTWPARLLGEAGLAALDVALASKVLERAVDRTMSSELARHAVDRAFQGPMIDAIARDVVRYRVVERVAEELLAEGVADRIVDRILAEGIADRVVDRILAGLTDSDEMWVLVEEVAASPAVTEAVTQQTASFAEQVAGGVRTRSHSADAWLERQARRALRRPES
jgi:hypothetical protein